MEIHSLMGAEMFADSGNKLKNKLYQHHTGYIGSVKTISLGKMLQEHPERAIEKAVKGMMPRGPLRREMYAKLKVFAGTEHKHAAQQPVPLEI